jgi:RHH-type transcriptional regulator, rel operon repressor / antitoxin RelB
MKTPQTPTPLNEWQVREIERGLEEADRGEFATDEEVARTFNKWSRVAENKPRG